MHDLDGPTPKPASTWGNTTAAALCLLSDITFPAGVRPFGLGSRLSGCTLRCSNGLPLRWGLDRPPAAVTRLMVSPAESLQDAGRHQQLFR